MWLHSTQVSFCTLVFLTKVVMGKKAIGDSPMQMLQHDMMLSQVA